MYASRLAVYGAVVLASLASRAEAQNATCGDADGVGSGTASVTTTACGNGLVYNSDNSQAACQGNQCEMSNDQDKSLCCIAPTRRMTCPHDIGQLGDSSFDPSDNPHWLHTEGFLHGGLEAGCSVAGLAYTPGPGQNGTCTSSEGENITAQELCDVLGNGYEWVGQAFCQVPGGSPVLSNNNAYAQTCSQANARAVGASCTAPNLEQCARV